MSENREFDRTHNSLKSFIEINAQQLEEHSMLIQSKVFTPFERHSLGKVKRKKAFQLLNSCTDIAQQLFKEICRKHSIDFWLSFVRRLPGLVPHWNESWLGYSTLAIIKWANWAEDTSFGQVQGKEEFGVAFLFSEHDLFDCFRIASLGQILDQINTFRRWLGKGANVIHEGSGRLRLDVSEEVNLAVQHYERRRPPDPIFADEGVLLSDIDPTSDVSAFIRSPFFVLGKLAPQISTAELRKTGQKFPITYFLTPCNPNAFINNLLRPYEDAIEDLCGTSINAIMHTLHAFCYLVMNSLPGPDDPDHFIFDQDPNDDDFAHRFGFMLGISRKGLVRFPEDYIRTRLASITTLPYSSSAEDARNLVDSFFSAFLLSQEQRSKIDVVTLQPIPLIYTSPGNNCYLDYLFLSDFLRWLVVRGREWYPTQHGDRFTLALKRFIKQQVTDVNVLPQRREYQSPSGERAQIDLLVHSGNVLYVIECKAFSKSRDFWLGKPKAVSERSQNIRKAVFQAQRAARIVTEVLEASDSSVPEVDQVEWVVCLPTQEYLNPLDKFGLLEEDIPRVCTPEELVRHLANRQ